MMRIGYILCWLTLPLWAVEKEAPVCAKHVVNRAMEDSAKWQNQFQTLSQRMQGKPSPFFEAGYDLDAIGRTHLRLRDSLPGYADLVSVADKPSYSEVEYRTLVERVAPSIERVLTDATASDDAHHAAMEALRRLSLLTARTQFEEEKEPEPPKPEEKKEEKKEEEEEEEKPEPPPPPPPDWGEEPDRFTPENKEIDPGDGKESKIMLRTNIAVPGRLLPQSYGDVVTATHIQTNRLIRPRIELGGPVQAKGVLQIDMLGRPNISLPMPYDAGLPGLQGTDFALLPIADDEWQLECQAGKCEIPVGPLPEGTRWRMDPMNEQAYAQKSGISQKDWSGKIRGLIADIKKKRLHDRREISQAIQDFMKSNANFLYYSKSKKVTKAMLAEADAIVAKLMKRGVPKPVALAESGMFNCDGAAWIMALLLKDFFGIPARIVKGRTIGQVVRDNGVNWSLVRSGDPRHAWVEVWMGDHWEAFDPTPDHEPEGGGGGGEDENSEEKPKDESPESKGGGGGDSKDSKPKDDKKNEKGDKGDKGEKGEKGDKGGNQGEGGQEEHDTAPGTQDDKAPPAPAPQPDKKEGAAEEGDGKPEPRELSPKLSVLGGDGDIPSKIDSDQLWHALFETVELYAMEHALMQGQHDTVLPAGTQTMNLMVKPGDQAMAAAAKPSLERLERHLLRHQGASERPVTEVLADLRLLVSEGKYREAFQELRALELQISAIGDRRPLRPSESAFLNQLQKVIGLFRQIQHVDASKYDLAEQVLNALPGKLSRKWVAEEYGNVLELGSLALDKFVSDLESGKLAPLIRMILLSDYADLVLASIEDPSWDEEKTTDRSPVPRRSNNDFVIARSPYEFPRMILNPKPGEPIFADLIRGRQIALGTRTTRRVQRPVRPLETKLTVLFADTSASMDHADGTPATKGFPISVQDTLLNIIVDKAMSETDISGNVLHELMIFNFDVKVHEGLRLSNQRQGLDFIRRNLKRRPEDPRELGGDTVLEAAVLKFYDAVGDVYNNPTPENRNRKLRRANGVVLSDGGAKVDAAKVREARKQIPAGVEIYLNFIGVNGTNAQLEALSKESGMSSKKPLYRTLSTQRIIQIMRDQTKLERDPDAFATSRPAYSGPAELVDALTEFSEPRLRLVDFESNPQPGAIASILAELRAGAASGVAPTGLLTRAVERISKIDGLDRALRERLFFTVTSTYSAVSGNRLDQMPPEDLEQIMILEGWMRK